jgi:hypothetical protein
LPVHRGGFDHDVLVVSPCDNNVVKDLEARSEGFKTLGPVWQPFKFLAKAAKSFIDIGAGKI